MLRDLLGNRPLPVHEALHYGAATAEALCRIHGQGSVYGCLEPLTIQITANGVELAPAVTTARICPYSAPEQVHGKHDDARSDVFALGAVLYEMLAGRQAFCGETPADLGKAILEWQPPPLADVPDRVAELVSKCLEKNARCRWQSAQLLLLNLRLLETRMRSDSGQFGTKQNGAQRAAMAEPELRLRRKVSLAVSESTPLLSPHDVDSIAVEQYRILRTRIIQHPKAPATIVVSAPGTGEGKTVTAINLVGTLALKSQEKVLLLDADLRRPAAHIYLNTPRAPGLAEVLAGKCRLEEALIGVENHPHFSLLLSGDPVGNAAELFDSPHWPALVESLRRQFRHVVIDSPPMEAVADYDLIAAPCDAVILVVRPDHTHRVACASALKKAGEKLLGVVLNDADEWLLWKWPSRYAYASQPM